MDTRYKSSKKSESARHRRLHSGHNDKGQPNEYGYLRDDINDLWTSWTMASSTSDMWRRIEQNGIETALQKLSSSKSDITVISSISSDDAVHILGVMVEFSEMINSIRLAFDENEQDIFDNGERESRYLTTTCPAILELWRTYTTFASDFALNFVQKSWHNSSEHRDLLAGVVDIVANTTKLIIVTVNMAAYHSLEESGTLRSVSVRESTSVIMNLQDTLEKIYKLDEKHTAVNALLELAGWQLHGINHMSEKVLKVEVEARAPDNTFEDYQEVMDAINSLIEKMKVRWGNKTDESVNQSQQQQQSQPPQQDRKTSTKASKNSKRRQSSKPEPTPPAEETKQPRDECLETLQKLKAIYNDFGNDAWEMKRLPFMRGTAGVQLKYRMESYEQIRKFRLNACAVHQRKGVLDTLGLTSDFELHSELFVVEPEGLSCDHDVIVSFPLTSPKNGSSGSNAIFLKLKVDGTWSDFENIEKEKFGNQTLITFSTRSLEAFAVVSFSPRDAVIVGPSGANFVSEDSGKVELTVPQDCYSSEVTLGVKTFQFDKRGYDTTFLGIITASVGVEISLEAGNASMSKHVTVQMPLDEAESDSSRDTELVVVRCNNESVQVLDKKQIVLRETGKNIYCVDMKGYWCVAVLRIRRIYLNMRESIKKEFLIGYGLRTPCNIVTFIDDVTRHEEKQTFVMEVIEKCDVDMAVDIKRGFGLIEVKKSRSKDILLQRGDQIAMVIDGQLRVTEAITDGRNILTYLRGARNTVFIPTEIKRDPEKFPDAMVFYKLVSGDSVIHSAAIVTRDLSELSTDSITARTGLNMHISDQKQDKQKDEAAVQILKMESLMSLARELTFEEGSSLGEQLGVEPDTIKRISQTVERDRVAANFQILCSWRGRSARATMADFLVSCLKAVGKLNYADLVMEVRTHNRGLERSDFKRIKTVSAGKSS